MYVEYYASSTSNPEFAITFERSEKKLYTAYVTGQPEAYWNFETQQWEVKVRPEVPGQRKQKGRARKATRSRVRLHKRVLRRTCR